MILRGTTISRCCAVGLLVLAASPFTAPFATYDVSGAHPLGAGVRTAIHDDTALKVRVASESLMAGVPAMSILPPFLFDTAMPFVDPTSRISGRQVLHSILRL